MSIEPDISQAAKDAATHITNIYKYDVEAIGRIVQRAIEINPKYAIAHNDLGVPMKSRLVGESVIVSIVTVIPAFSKARVDPASLTGD